MAGGSDKDYGIFGFLSHFEHGFAKPNRFRVELELPPGVNIGENTIGVNNAARIGNIKKMNSFFNGRGGVNIKCHTATFPQRSILTQEIRQNSAPFRTPFSASYDPVTFSFYSNGDLDTRFFFDVWQSAVVNLGTNTMNFYSEYVSDVKMFMVDEYGLDTYSITLYEAYPINIGIIDVSYSQEDAVSTITATLAYKSWAPMYNSQEDSGSSATKVPPVTIQNFQLQ